MLLMVLRGRKYATLVLSLTQCSVLQQLNFYSTSLVMSLSPLLSSKLTAGVIVAQVGGCTPLFLLPATLLSAFGLLIAVCDPFVVHCYASGYAASGLPC